MVLHFDMCIMLTLAIGCFWTTNVAAKSVCYPGLRCFSTTLPCNVKFLPQSPSEINTEFFLFTPDNKKKHQVIDWTDNGTIVNSNFNGKRGTKFIIHGFTHEIMRPEYILMKDLLLSIGDFNVILVNWADGAGKTADINSLKDVARENLLDTLRLPPDYLKARQNTRLVGRQIGELARKLQELKKASFSSMHLIGHSLGAQTAGYAGEHLSGKIGRITGLDPAGPGYQVFSSTPGCVLEESDAQFVDIIHTDVVLGNEKAVGHQDFYPSGGLTQVSCPFWDFICSHLRAVEFFNESIANKKCEFRAYPCKSWFLFKLGVCRKCGGKKCPRMGYFADPSTGTGRFFLQTNKKEPYCKK